MTKHTSWLFAAALLAGTTAYAQEKAPAKASPPKTKEQVKFKPPVIVKDEEVKVKKPVVEEVVLEDVAVKPKEQAKFRPPVIVKDKEVKAKKPVVEEVALKDVQAKPKEMVKFKPPVIVKDDEVALAASKPQGRKKAAPSAKKPLPRVKMSDLKPETRAKIERGEALTEAEHAEVRKAAKPPLKDGEDLPPLPPPPPPKVRKAVDGPPPPPPPPAQPKKS